jgi:sugar lactone lactonase YvrE
MTIAVECVVDCQARLGEGAWWDADDRALWWVDIKAGLVHRYDPSSGENASFDWGEPVACLARRDAGGLVVGTASGIHLFDPDTGARDLLADPEPGLTGNRFNDGTTDPQGRFWAGTMRDDGSPPERRGRFYRVDADHDVTGWFDPVFTTNGLAFSPDGRVMYLADTNRDVRTIWACDYDLETGTPSAKRLFFDTCRIAGRPDGATVDADGCYWMAGFGGWQVVRITPDGQIDRIIEMPVERPTKVMFGGASLDTLYVTSMGDGLADDPAQTLAGGLFAITGLGTGGVPQARFAG